MKKLNKKHIFYIVALITLVIIIVIGVILVNRPKPIKKVEIATAKDLYENLIKKDDNYRYKLYGYTYDENQNVEMSVMQAYIKDGKVYNMNDEEIGEYSDKTIDEVLDKATVKIYHFIYKDGKYTLKS